MPEGDVARRLIASSLAMVLVGCGATSMARQATPTPPTVSASPGPVAVVPSVQPPQPTPSPVAVPLPGGSPGAAPVAWPLPATSYLVRDLPRRALQGRLERLAARYDLPGVAVTIRWPDGREWSGAAGRADVTGGQAVTPGTAFALGSVSKTYTAALILTLMEEGRLTLDDPVARHLPKLKLDQRITIRMLLDHTSGLADYFLNAAIDRPLQRRPDASWTTAQTLRYLRKPLFPPGRGWAYSNTNYLLLGLVAQAVDGRTLPAQVRDRLLEPLGLDETWSQAAERPRAETSRGHRLIGTGAARKPSPVIDGRPVMPFRSVITAAGGAGNIAATSRDAARWMDALVRGDVLRPETKERMLADAAYTDALGARVPYGMGLQITELRHRVSIGHSGRLLGFRAVVRVLPGDGMTIAVLTNQSTIDPTLVASSMLAYVLPKVTDCPTCNRPE
jgi:D-alanyl-D-alanine carboxypeptidase